MPNESLNGRRRDLRKLAEWLLFAVLLALAVMLVYRPAMHGEPIWDDSAHMTRKELSDLDGLRRIWLELGATQQYYPLMHSAFWLQHQFWKNSVVEHHGVNIALHISAALLLALVLRRLSIPGAYLAAAIFALHPVHVESVAWISELKNTLSAVFYLGSLRAYLQFDRERLVRWYWLSMGLFIAGLLSKTVVATLPAALLVIFWWQRGRLSWRSDAIPLLPFFTLGVISGLFTAWVEYGLIEAKGSEFDFSLLERLLIAGRVVWFYLGKLIWPANLTFFYPRWQINADDWWLYAYLLAAVVLLVGCWGLRRRWRGPLAAVLLFGGTLFPVLGFFNVFPFRYSFVADHFQYLASASMIVLVAGTVATLLLQARPVVKALGWAACMGILVTLGVLTYRQTAMYSDAETLFRTTLARNPDCWIAWNNLGSMLDKQGLADQASEYYQRAVDLNPEYPEALNNLGTARQRQGKPDEALDLYRRSLTHWPRYDEANFNLGKLCRKRGQYSEAIERLRVAHEVHPSAVSANELAQAMHGAKKFDESIPLFREAVRLAPNSATYRVDLARALSRLGRHDEAEAIYLEVLNFAPKFAPAHLNLANLLYVRGRTDEAVVFLQKAIRLQPEYAQAHHDLGVIYANQGQLASAIAEFEEAIRIEPDYGDAHQKLKAVRARQRPTGE